MLVPYAPAQGGTVPSDQALPIKRFRSSPSDQVNCEPASVMAEAERIPRVLVVDDERNIREVAQVALKFHGCTVSTAATGPEAIRQADAPVPDLIGLDVLLPDFERLDVCRRL